LEFFAIVADQKMLFRKIDDELGLNVVESSFDTERGPDRYDGFYDLLEFLIDDPDSLSKRTVYYASSDISSLVSQESIFNPKLASYNLIRNPDVITYLHGGPISQGRILRSQFGRSKESVVSRQVLSKIKRLAKKVFPGIAMAKSGELVFQKLCNSPTKAGVW